jgi:hypothetical protein
VSFVWVASLCGQRGHHFSWQDACFKNPGAPYCQGRDYAVKRTRPGKDAAAGDTAAREGVTDPLPSTPQSVTPSVIVIGGIDWQFVDPFADALAGFNFMGLSASPLARTLIARLGANQGISETDIKKIFDRLSGVDQIALSMRDNRIVVMVTGRVTDSTLPAPEGLKIAPVSGNAMLVGHADAVDEAVQRLAMKAPPTALTRMAAERQASSEFWAIGSAGVVGPQAVSAGVERFSLTVSVRNGLTSDAAFEFDGAPSADTLGKWQTTLGETVLEGEVVHHRLSMEADEAQQKFGQIAASPLGQRLADLVQAARYLPARDTTVLRQNKPVIYGLDSGPKEVTQLPSR